MGVQDLICRYLQKRGELAAAYAAPEWRKSRLSHIDRISRELAVIEVSLEECRLDDEYFADLLPRLFGLVAKGWKLCPTRSTLNRTRRCHPCTTPAFDFAHWRLENYSPPNQ